MAQPGVLTNFSLSNSFSLNFGFLEKSDEKLEDVEKPTVDETDKKEEKFLTQKAQQDERLATAPHYPIVAVIKKTSLK